jgi:subtilisin family serine protease
MRQTTMLLLAAACIFGATLQATPQQSKGPRPDRGPKVGSDVAARAAGGGRVRVIVELSLADPQVSTRESLARTAERVVARVSAGALAKKFSDAPFLVLNVDEADLAALAASDDVASVRLDALRKPMLSESVPLIGAPAAWAIGATGTGWSVAVVDSGVDKAHPYFAGKVVSEACYSTTNAIFGATSVCPGGVDTVATGSGVHCSTSIAGCDHGTHIAGIAAGNGATYPGVAKGASIIAVQVYSRIDDAAFCAPDVPPCVGAFDSDVLAGLDRVYALRDQFQIASVSLALGSGAHEGVCDAQVPTYKTAIDRLRTVGIPTVISSGNDGSTNTMTAPACVSTAISVGATDKSDVLAPFTNRSPILNFLAPGDAIFSPSPDSGGGFSFFDGTSMAAAHVAGAWALVKSVRPTATVLDVVAAFNSTAVPISDAASGITRRRINVGAAVQSVHHLRGHLPDFDAFQTGDFLWRHQTPGTFAMWLMNGGSIIGSSFFGVGPEWRPAVYGDLNNDGTTDVVWRSATTVAIWFMNGTTVQASTFFGVGADWAVAAAGDLNADGKAEVIWWNRSLGALAVWYMNGTAIQDAVFHSVGYQWDLIGVGDLDGSGTADLIWRNATGTTLVWFMAGGSMQSTATFGVGAEWALLGVADVNGDDRGDMLWRHNVTGAVSIWLMDGGTQLGVSVQNVNLEWSFIGAGDINGDGKADLAWRKPPTLAVWFMNGGAIQSSTFFGVGAEWTPIGAQ